MRGASNSRDVVLGETQRNFQQLQLVLKSDGSAPRGADIPSGGD